MKTDFFDQVRTCYTENRQGLFTYALALTRSRAASEDIVHGVICRLLDRGKMPGEVRPYLFRAARNAAVDNWRRESSREDQLFELDLTGAGSVEQPRPPAAEGPSVVYIIEPSRPDLRILGTKPDAKKTSFWEEKRGGTETTGSQLNAGNPQSEGATDENITVFHDPGGSGRLRRPGRGTTTLPAIHH